MTSRSICLLAVLLALTAACESRGYVAPPAGAAPIATKAPWTVPVHAGPFDAAIPAGAEIGRQWNSASDSDSVFDAVGLLPTSTWKFGGNYDLDSAKIERVSREALTEARWATTDDASGAAYSLQGTITALALDTYGAGGTASRARAKVTVAWKLVDSKTGVAAATGTTTGEIRDAQPNVMATIVPGAVRSAQYKFMGDAKVRELIRDPAHAKTEPPATK